MVSMATDHTVSMLQRSLIVCHVKMSPEESQSAQSILKCELGFINNNKGKAPKKGHFISGNVSQNFWKK